MRTTHFWNNLHQVTSHQVLSPFCFHLLYLNKLQHSLLKPLCQMELNLAEIVLWKGDSNVYKWGSSSLRKYVEQIIIMNLKCKSWEEGSPVLKTQWLHKNHPPKNWLCSFRDFQLYLHISQTHDVSLYITYKSYYLLQCNNC